MIKTNLVPLENVSGNIVPNSWYKIFKTSKKPDLVSITILAEVLFKYRTGEMVKRRWRVNYGYFENKFEFSKNQIRCAFTRLESFGIITREVLTENYNNRKYGGVLYLIFDCEKLDALQKNLSPPVKNTHPPCEKSQAINSTKRSNEIITTYDVEKINASLKTSHTLDYCEKVLSEIKQKYPNLIFSSKCGLIQYLKKTLQSSLKDTLPTKATLTSNLDLQHHICLLSETITPEEAHNSLQAIWNFNHQMKDLLKDLLPNSYLAIANSFLPIFHKDGSCVVKFLCKQSLVLPYKSLIEEIACKVLANIKVDFQYLDNKPSLEESFAILKLRLYFIYGLETYISWFNRLNFGSIEGQECTLVVSTKFLRNWIQDHYGDTILSCIQSINKVIQNLTIDVQPSLK